MRLTSFFDSEFVILQELLVHLFNSLFGVLWINKINESISTLHDDLSYLTVLLKSLFKVIFSDPLADTSYVDLGGFGNASFVSPLPWLTAAALTVAMVASATVDGAASTPRRAPTVFSWGVVVAAFARV